MLGKIGSLFVLVVLILGSCQKEPAVSTQMEESFYVRNGQVDIPAFVYGNGASKVFILVVHGGPGGNGLEYRGGTYSEQLEKKYAMVYTDQRHQGNSHGHLTDSEITVDAMVEDLHLTVTTLKERYGNDISIFMMGHSWGGTLGTAYMIKDDYQSELAGWIEVDGAHDIPKLNIELIKMIQTIGGDEVAAGNNVTDWNEMIGFVNGLDTNNITTDQGGTLNGYGHRIEALLSQLHHSEGASSGLLKTLFLSPNNPAISGLSGLQLPQAFMNEVEATSMTNDLYKITIPTLLQWGKYDFVVPPALGYSAFDKISSTHKYLKIYEHSAHSPMNNEPDLFVADIVTFIETYK
ncbi:MAG: pimeloyl-ACP methyl ester carboxylesterase [Crocinitomix sp.]|jgi:pimeloyl-ACP methyl ester carboxylesterase